jgi:hypothetical protein
MATKLTGVTFQKSPYNSALKIGIQPGIEAISTEILTKALNTFILHLHKVHDL